MTNTLAQEIARRYQTLQTTVIKEVGKDRFPFPKLGEVDATDISLMITTYFSKCEGDYTSVIKNILWVKGIKVSDDEFGVIYPSVKDFIDWVLGQLRSRII